MLFLVTAEYSFFKGLETDRSLRLPSVCNCRNYPSIPKQIGASWNATTVTLARHNALLRSLSVAKVFRNGREASNMMVRAENLGRAYGISELWLLTTTAVGFFRRAGYAKTDRNSTSVELKDSTQFAQLRPSSPYA
ncbi:hypothetical protein B0G76_6784 [Paraburkholderia sp. BL23I1N1]|uniref:hypothetical protein n=1 Tax=Paraburkholderia sp. BL23I1N1 TaxID=1938802 RepID=UPI000FF1B088|nr:hypothetical protein [Paraburkholderia sp. BL23I1N1]RKE25257.1 hypothetical protein B0G76_6784 [Paraburkholderia sp. BL23I1N1]